MFYFAGFLGGMIRGIVGILKYSLSYKDVSIKPVYFGLTVLVSGLVGLLCVWIISDMGISFLGLNSMSISLGIVFGYAGGDLLENIFKIIIRKPILFKKT